MRFIEDLKKQGKDNVVLWEEEISKMQRDIDSNHLNLKDTCVTLIQ